MTDMETLKEKLKSKVLTIGSWITLGHPSIAEIMARAGFDWLTVDMEHSAITMHQAQQLIQVIDLCGVAPLVRIGENNPYFIKRVMDAGAHGVIVPMVNTVEDARKAVEAVKYPPVGKRGVGLARAQGYGFNFEEYKDWAEKESVVIVQVEHFESVNNLDKILKVEGVDGFFVGPYDLSASMGKPGEFDHADVLDALKRVKDISANSSLVSGYHVVPPDPCQVKDKIKEGYRFIAYSLDTYFLGDICRKGLQQLKE